MTKLIRNRILKTALIILVAVVGLLGALMLFFNSEFGQKRLSKLVFQQISNKIGTPIEGKLKFSIPDWIRLEDVLIKDKQSDTLLHAQKLHLDVALWELLNNKLVVEQVELNNATAYIRKENGAFNFDYILNAFSSSEPKELVVVDTSFASIEIVLNGINLQKVKALYEDKDSEQWFNVDLGTLKSGFKSFDIDKGIYDLKDSKIANLTVKGSLGKPTTDTSAATELPQILLKKLETENVSWNLDLGEQITSGEAAFLNIDVDDLDINRLSVKNATLFAHLNHLNFSTQKEIKVANGEINFSDLGLKDLVLKIEDVNHADKKTSGRIQQFSFVEKSGFLLKRGSTSIQLVDDNLELKSLVLETADSKISSDIEMNLDFENISKSKFNAKIPSLQLALSEALYFSQSLKQNASFKAVQKDIVFGKGRIFGTFEDVNLDHVYLKAPKNTSVTLNGKVNFQNNLLLDLQVNNFSSTAADLKKFAGGLPTNIELPEQVNLNGSLKGTLNQLQTLAYLNSSFGGARLDLELKNVTSKSPSYQGHLVVEDMAVGRWVKNKDLGNIAGEIRLKGSNFTQPQLYFEGDISEITYAKETYKQIKLNGEFVNNKANLKGFIEDNKAKLDLDILVDLSQPTVTAQGNLNLNSLSLKALGLSQEDIYLKGKFDVNELIADLNRPFIDFKGKNIIVSKGEQEYPVGDLTVFTEYGDLEKRLDLKGEFIDLSLAGNFEYKQLQNILLGEINNYFELPSYVASADTLNYYFNVEGNVEYHPVFTAFLPSLKSFKPITIKSSLSSEENKPLLGRISIPFLQFDSIQVINTAFEFMGDGDTLKYRFRTDQVSNESFRLRNASLEGRLRDNLASFDLAVKDSLGKDIHSLVGLLESDGTNVRINFDETGSMLFYKDWGGNPYGYIDYSSKGLVISNVVFSSEGQILRISSVSDEPNSPLTVFAEDLDLNFLSRAILQDSLLISGYLDLNLELAHFFDERNMAFTGEVSIADFEFNQIELGNLNVEARSDDLKEIALQGKLEGLQNNFDLLGSYYVDKKEPLDFKLAIGNLDFKVLEPFLEGIVYDVVGNIEGELLITGEPTKPQINGLATMDAMQFKIQETAALIKVDNQKLEFKNSKLLLNKWVLKDANNSEMYLNGQVDLSILPNYSYNFDITSDNFLIANSERGQSELFYGIAYLQSKLNVKGRNTDFRLTGDIRAREYTNLTMLLPDDGYGEDLNSVVTFVDFKNRRSMQKTKFESSISLANAVNINVAIDQNSRVNILMNPITNDMLSATGNAQLNIGFDNAGDLFIIGRLTIVNGSYEMTYQAIQKRFVITEGSNSNIDFAGDPTKGRMNITAEYEVPGRKDITSYPDILSKTSQNFGRTPVDLRVDLVLTEEVLQPNVEFQIVVNQNDLSGSKAELAKILQDEGMYLLNNQGEKVGTDKALLTPAKIEALNQNAIMLLVAGTFTANQIFESLTNSGGGAYEDLARRNASQLISSQLEKYASGLIKGVDINLGLQSSGGVVSGKNAYNDRSTNLNVGVSKSLANDRLLLSVGKNFELENKSRRSDEIFDNVEANWLITRDGRYRLKMFRKNQNQTALEGSVIETGMGLILGFEYNQLNELWTKKK